MYTIAILLSAYSVIEALVLALGHFRPANYSDHPGALYLGITFVIALGSIQLCHFLYLTGDISCIHDWYYRGLLFAVAPAFYLFSNPLLSGYEDTSITKYAHGLPVLLSPLLPANVAMPLAFGIGAVYMLWLAKSLYALRSQRSYFYLEIVLLGTAFLIALTVAITGLGTLTFEEKDFFIFYASATGFAFILINLALAISPRLPTKIAEAVSDTYATTTLASVDCDTALSNLDRLMQEERIYEDPEIDLATLASQLAISSHQLSELINTRLGKGFSRYMREQRVEAAKTMLVMEPSASVLSVGLSVGFASQSNFYDAFREITGMTPGKYRDITLHSSPG